MHRFAWTASLALALACAGKDAAQTAGPASPTEAPTATTPPPAPAPAPPPPAPAPVGAESVPMADPADLYATCKDRVEGPSAAGECTTDADCVTAGCSGEVCAAKASAEGLMTTCEIRPCFAALDTCGCVEGVCSWALKEGPVSPLPGGGQPVQLPQ